MSAKTQPPRRKSTLAQAGHPAHRPPVDPPAPETPAQIHADGPNGAPEGEREAPAEPNAQGAPETATVPTAETPAPAAPVTAPAAQEQPVAVPSVAATVTAPVTPVPAPVVAAPVVAPPPLAAPGPRARVSLGAMLDAASAEPPVDPHVLKDRTEAMRRSGGALRSALDNANDKHVAWERSVEWARRDGVPERYVEAVAAEFGWPVPPKPEGS